MKKRHLLLPVCLMLCISKSTMSSATEFNPWQINPDTGFDIAVEQPPPTIPLLTILLEFTDLPHRDSQNHEIIKEQIFCDNSPTNSCMNGYWLESSYGRFEYENVGHFSWITVWNDPETPEDESTVAYWDSLTDYGAGKFRW